MRRYGRFAVAVCFAVLASSSLAFANDVHATTTLNVSFDTQCPPATCTFDTGFDGSPATGSGDFTSIGLPFTYSFETGIPLSWCAGGSCGTYQANFGYGGSFEITGPAGLTFSGVIRYGSVDVQGDVSEIFFFYEGQWSDGFYSSGLITTMTDPANNFLVEHFDSVVNPEPSSFLLLGTGALGLWPIVKRQLRR